MSKQNIVVKVLCIALFFIGARSGTAQNPVSSVEQTIALWQTVSGLSTASVCMAVNDYRTGEVLIKSEPQQSLVPASILKLVTTATALEVLGPDFRFQTTLAASGVIKQDTLFGDLQIIGGGDPTLGSSYFPENNHFMDDWIREIQNKNIRVIKGNLVLDATIYESQMIPDTWIWEDIGNYYGAGASGISVYDNLYEIHLSSAKEAGVPTQMGKISPEIPGLDLQNETLSSDINSDQAYVFGSPMDSHRVIRGTIPKNKSDFVVKASMPDPSALLASEFRKKLLKNGIQITGTNKFKKAKSLEAPWTVLSVNQSPVLRDIIKVTNHESVNLFAEHFLKQLAFKSSGLGTTREGCKFIVDFWKGKGLDMTGFFMNDGSGLSRFNAMTAIQMTNILNYMKTKSNYASDFYESLAGAGEGTLTVLNEENFPNQCLRAKSGSMTRVRCFAGYLTTDSQRRLSYCFMLNNFSCTQATAIRKIEEVLVEMRKL
ncbi:MAG TPA: D-alanyl-D-alanine carboxypeptidase/D-alanyl-D-alanine-endopeptidase [Prolixibacteraceae bacterium]|jgi:D-alanyl-D-alanine carboxypeptidase/D-alanyl-D-alanine-endopeptidase (penicillin-binding protein 4)|nr:D-alanyl-D-alanine carboxypeptidase/D-alanyl-D-alanine-endopeptidase [Prolixibacteraceae bacterium]